jgi:hypothetical protein
LKFAKLLIITTAFTTYSYATEIDLASIDPDKARAYQAYLLTFEWPQGTSTEEITYQEIKNSTTIPSYDIPVDSADSTTLPATIEPLFNTFDRFNEKVGKHAKILANEKWTLIFPEAGFTHHETFHSTVNENGYADLSGEFSVKLGRYLETTLNYHHYLFAHDESDLTPSALPQDNNVDRPQSDTENTDAAPIENTTFNRPTKVFNLALKNKTASKKINYLDHPIIGTLLYFVPMELEDAIEQKALESFTPDLGENKTQEDLTSNELE